MPLPSSGQRLAARRVLTAEGFVDDAVVVIDGDGTITAIEAASGSVPDRVIAPGFVDVPEAAKPIAR